MIEQTEYTRLPPQAVEVEQAVLGALMLHPSVIDGKAGQLGDSHFYRAAHRQIYGAICRLAATSQPFDVVMVAEELRKSKQLEDAGGEYYLAELVDGVSSLASTDYYAEILDDKRILRDMIELSAEMMEKGYNAGAEGKKLLDDYEGRIFSIAAKRGGGYVGADEAVDMTQLMIEKFKDARYGITGTPTGFGNLDILTAGLHSSELTVLAARPSVGKTAMGLDIARHAAKMEIGAGIISMEMNVESLTLRLAGAEGKADTHMLKLNRMPSDERDRLDNAFEKVRHMPIYIDDRAGMTLTEVCGSIRRMAREKGIGLAVIDYLQIMSMPSAENRNLAIAEITSRFKNLAKELKMPVILISQLNRAPERENREPKLADLRDSGTLEQDGDLVIFLHRMAQSEEEKDDEMQKVKVIVAKQRNGPIGYVELGFFKKWASFRVMEEQREVF